MIKKILILGERIVTKLETNEVPFFYFILTSFFAATLRIFIEMFSDSTLFLFEIFFHYYLFYIAIVLALIILFYLVVRKNIRKTAQVILSFSFFIILAPIFDLMLSLGKGYDIAYMFPEYHGNLLSRFVTLFGSFNGTVEMGITPGMRIEIALILLASFIYFFIKKRDALKGIISIFLTYSVIFLFCATPYIIKIFFNVFNIEYELSDTLISNFYLLLIFILSVWIFYLYNKRYFISILKDIRIFRLMHFESMFILGIALAKVYSSGSVELNSFTLFQMPFIMIAILFAWLFSVFTNNLTDHDIDKISNKDRPTVSNAIPFKDYKQLSWIFLILAVLYSSNVNFETLFLILLFIGNYFLYSMPPLRLKRVPFFSKIFISLNSLILVMIGYFFIARNLNVPGNIIAFFLIGFTAVLNFIDIKDYYGDKQENIQTLPVILGLKKSKILIGLFFLILYPCVYFLLKEVYLLIPLTIFGIIQFFFITKRDYSEKPIFIVYLISIFALIGYLWFL